MFNVSNPKAKARMQKILLRQMAVIERGFAKGLRIVLNDIYKEVADLLVQGTDSGIDVLVDQWLPDMFQTYNTGYKRAGAAFSGIVFDAFAHLKFTTPPESKGMADEFWNSFRSFINLNTASRVVGANKTTKKWISRLIRKGTEEGKSPGLIAKDLVSKGKKINKHRAMRIARTEVHMVSNYSTQAAVKSTRLETEKEWVAFIDDRTRTDHIKANGKRVAMDRDFKIGGALMAYPGDPRGGAKNVIHCRCVLLYHVVKNKYKII